MTASPYKAPNASVDVEVAGPKESDFVKAFISFVLCAVIAGAISGAIVGGIIGGVWGTSGAVDMPAFRTTVTVFSGLVGIIVNYFVFRFFVNLFIVRKLAPTSHAAA